MCDPAHPNHTALYQTYRVTAGTILHATLGTIFGQHNLGNLYSQTDANAYVEIKVRADTFRCWDFTGMQLSSMPSKN